MNEVKTLLTGRGLVESPRWHGDRLYFSDWSAGEVIAVDLAGHSEVIAHVKSLPLCTAWLPDGRLVIVSSPDGRLLRLEPDGSLVTHADLGKPGWNDIVVDGRGNAYVNRPGFDMMAGAEFKPGFVTLATADGSVRQVADDIAFPNGMAVTPDNSTLIVADSYRPRWLRLRAWRPRRDDAVHRGSRVAGHARDGAARHGSGAHHPGRRAGGGLALTLVN
jgi:sugar lactone lactonase YvrE